MDSTIAVSGKPGAIHSRRGRRRVALLAFGWVGVTGGCVDPGIDCWTRARIKAAGSERPQGPVREVLEGVVAGEVVVEDPANWWTGGRLTGERCRIEVEHRHSGTFVRMGGMEGAARLEARMGPGDAPFFIGRTVDGAAVVLQHHRGRPVALTLARFEPDERLRYGACGERETPLLECHANGLERKPGG